MSVIAQMEATGIKVDRDHLARLSGEFTAGIAALETEIHALAGQTFAIGSTQQLGAVLFDKLGLKGGKKGNNKGGKSGKEITAVYAGGDLDDEIGWIFAMTGDDTRREESEEHEAPMRQRCMPSRVPGELCESRSHVPRTGGSCL